MVPLVFAVVGFAGMKKVKVELSKKKAVVRRATEQSRAVKTLWRSGCRSELLSAQCLSR